MAKLNGTALGAGKAIPMCRFPGALVTMHHAPDGETHEVFATRVWNILAQLTQKHQGHRVLVVTHGGAIRAMLRRLYTLMGQLDQPVPPIDNTSITEIQLRNGRWSILRTNDVAHLQLDEVPDAVAPQDEGNLFG
jgi:broad specificity phosphatase PhoE